MKSVALSAVCLWGVLSLCASMTATSEPNLLNLLQTADSIPDFLPCGNWDCECAFKRQRGCCCVSNQLDELEDDTFMRMVHLWKQLKMLQDDVDEIAGPETHIAFTAAMSSSDKCFGPFNTNVTIPYSVIFTNQGFGYNPALGVFTAPRSGVYVFSFTAYSNVGEHRKLYHKVQLMRNSEVLVSMWEDNREDMEDSGTQVVAVYLERGCQVYTELMTGRILCGNTGPFNTFSGFLLYPDEVAP